MDSETQINIGKYIDGELPNEALRKFEQQLKTDKALQEEVRFQQTILQSLQAKNEFENEKENLVSFLNRLEQNVDLSDNNEKTTDLESTSNEATSAPSTIFKRLTPFVTLAVAAAILLFIWSPWQTNLSNAQFADANYKTYILDTNMDDANTLNTYFKDGKFAYDDKDYATAEKEFENYLAIKPNDYKVILAKGNCEFQLGNFDEAIRTFQQVANAKTVYSNTGHWYLALSYLKNDNVEKAKTSLQQITEQSEYDKQAKKLLQQLNN